MTDISAAAETKALGRPDLPHAFDDFMRAFEAFKEANDERLDEIEKRLPRRRRSPRRRSTASTRRSTSTSGARRAVAEARRARRSAARQRPGRRRRASTRRPSRPMCAAARAPALRALEAKAMSVGSRRTAAIWCPPRPRPRSAGGSPSLSPIRAHRGGAHGFGAASTRSRSRPPARPSAGSARPPPGRRPRSPHAGRAAVPDDGALRHAGGDRGAARGHAPSTSTSGSPARSSSVFAEQEGAAFVSGDGANKPKGFLDHTKVAEADLGLGQARLSRHRRRRRLRRRATPSDVLIDLSMR